MSTSKDDKTVETPDDTTTYIVDRYTDDKGNTVEVRMPTSEWATYCKENGL